MFDVIKNCPAPTPLYGRGRPNLYPFHQMEVGDAFDAPRDLGKQRGGTDRRQNNINNCTVNFRKNHNPDARFTTRLIDENTVRCWRVA
jgi:hypothetical protein